MSVRLLALTIGRFSVAVLVTYGNSGELYAFVSHYDNIDSHLAGDNLFAGFLRISTHIEELQLVQSTGIYRPRV
jgi:hypothetical protein